MVGDGSYLMMNSELATSVMLGLKLTVVLLDNRGYGCINRLQRATGSESFNNLLQHTETRDAARHRFRRPCGKSRRECHQGRQHRRARGGPEGIAREADVTTVIVIDTDPLIATDAGGHWWDVAVPEVSVRPQVNEARKSYEKALGAQRVGD